MTPFTTGESLDQDLRAVTHALVVPTKVNVDPFERRMAQGVRDRQSISLTMVAMSDGME